MEEKDKYTLEKEKEVIRKQSTIQLLSVALAISMVINVILLFGFYQDSDEETGITIEQHDAPIIINITINSNGLLNETIITEVTEPETPDPIFRISGQVPQSFWA